MDLRYTTGVKVKNTLSSMRQGEIFRGTFWLHQYLPLGYLGFKPVLKQGTFWRSSIS